MLPEDKKRKMRYNVIAMLRESGMPAPSEKEEVMDDAELLADAEEKKEEGEDERADIPTDVDASYLKPKKKKKPQSLA